ncbi:MAG: alpha/beta hydrolase [Gordonia sp. (in: high G+C Gram-positive bacteria)]
MAHPSRWERLRTAGRIVGGYQVAADHETPYTVIHTGPHRVLRRYGTESQRAGLVGRPPILLIPPLAVPARCYDLGPGQSVVEHLLAAGRRPYVVDFGNVSRADRHLGFADYFDDIVPDAIARVLADVSAEGVTRLDLAAWSLGGTISFLTVAAHPELPVRSITAIGTPLDYKAMPGYPLVRRLMRPFGATPITLALRTMRGIPAPLVRIAYRATAWDRELKKLAYIVRNADNTEALARMQVIDRFQNSLPGYAGEVSVQMWEKFVYRDELATGVLDFDGRRVDITAVGQPIRLFGSHRDAIASWRAVHHGVSLFAASADIGFVTVPASHLGLIAGDAAFAETWPHVVGFLAELDAGEALPPS